MLVVGRCYKQRVFVLIGDKKVIVSVERIGLGNVRLGFEGPGDVRFVREEIYVPAQSSTAEEASIEDRGITVE